MRPAWRVAASLFALAAIGGHLVELVRLVGDAIADRELGHDLEAFDLFEARLRRELSEVAGLAPDTIETILVAAHSPAP
jgi:hypothetical protein